MKDKPPYFFLIVIGLLLASILSLTNPVLQRAYDGGLVLAQVIDYPESSVMYDYYAKSWTILHQLTGILITLDITPIAISIGLFAVAVTFIFLGIVFCVQRITRSSLYAVSLASLAVIFSVHLGSTDYPFLLYDTEHTYGLFALSMSTLIFGLVAQNFVGILALLLPISIAVHPVVGLWLCLVSFPALLSRHLRKSIFTKRIIAASICGFSICITSLLYQKSLAPLQSTALDSALLQIFISQWDYHRALTGWYAEYFFASVGFLVLYWGWVRFRFPEPRGEQGLLVALSCSILGSLLLFLLVRGVNLPFFAIRWMPTRVTLLHTVVALPILASIFWAECSHRITSKGQRPLAFIGSLVILLPFCQVPSFLSVSEHWATLEKQSTDVVWQSLRAEKNVFQVATIGRASVLTHRFAHKPVILDTTGIDFVAYLPQTVLRMKKIIESLYGIPFDSPPASTAHSGEIRPEAVRPYWESLSVEKWEAIAKSLNFQAVVAPKSWTLSLPASASGKNFIMYKIIRMPQT